MPGLKNLNTLLLICIVILLCSCNQSINKDLIPSKYPAVFNELMGTWKYPDKAVYEEWFFEDNFIKSSVYEIKDGDTNYRESIKIIELSEEFYYEVKVYNQNDGKAIQFKLMEFDSDKLVFKNENHDFPQKIKYHILDKNNLEVIISGDMGNGTQEIPFNYMRIK